MDTLLEIIARDGLDEEDWRRLLKERFAAAFAEVGVLTQ